MIADEKRIREEIKKKQKDQEKLTNRRTKNEMARLLKHQYGVAISNRNFP